MFHRHSRSGRRANASRLPQYVTLHNFPTLSQIYYPLEHPQTLSKTTNIKLKMDETTSPKQLNACLPGKHHWSDSSDAISIMRPIKGLPDQELSISFQRTVRVADNNKVNDLPPSMGKFPIYDTADYKKTMPQHMSAKGGFFIPMYRKSPKSHLCETARVLM